MIDYREYIEANEIRRKVTTRGGGIEIDLTGLGFHGQRMAAYQNYLGGGMLGAVQVNDTIRSGSSEQAVRVQLQYSSEFHILDEVGDMLKRYYHSLTDPGEGTWEGSSYEENQARPSSGY